MGLEPKIPCDPHQLWVRRVEGLDASDVTILDTRGTVLTETNKSDGLAGMTTTQYELQQKVENYLAQKAQRLLDGALGVGNAMVQVNAELDFRRVEKNLEQYDPENSTVRSEQVTEERSVLRDSLPPSTRTNSVMNYEINKSIEHIVENVGNVKRLSVATMVNDKMVTKQVNGAPVTESKPRDAQEMDQLTQIVKRTVGFDSTRNDDISVVNIPFNDIAKEDLLTQKDNEQQWDGIAVKVFLVLAMVAAVVIIRSLLNRMKFKVGDSDVMFGTYVAGELPGSMHSARNIRLPAADSEIPIEVVMKAQRRNQISEFAKNKPDEASRLLKVWLADEAQV